VEDKARTVVAKGKDAASDVQDKAKTAFEKGKDAVADAREFTKGNVEALVESGKILAAGLKDLGSDYVAGAKSALTTLKADAHQLKSVKSPTDFFKLQGEFVRSAFHSAKENASKRREAVVELAQDAFAPISDRISLVSDKFKKAA
jgi:phasin family protein